jgi:hypothetical protein
MSNRQKKILLASLAIANIVLYRNSEIVRTLYALALLAALAAVILAIAKLPYIGEWDWKQRIGGVVRTKRGELDEHLEQAFLRR